MPNCSETEKVPLAGKRVLVTGADGFIGGHMVEALLRRGCRPRAFVAYNSANSWGSLELLDQAVLAQIEVMSGDIRDRGSVARAMDGVDVAIHLAALAGVPYSFESPESYVATNVTGTLNVLEEARRRGTERVLTTSTSEVYGTPQRLPMDESHPWQSRSPYAATKIAADRIAESYYRSFGLPVTIVRPFNTFGPRQSARAVIPAIITQLLAGQDEIKLGTVKPTRDMVYVKDTVEGYLRIAESPRAIGEEINIATGREVSVGHMVETLIGLIRPQARVALDPSRLRPGQNEEEDRVLGDNSKLARLTGWTPEYTFERALEETAEWFARDADLVAFKSGKHLI